MLHNLCHNLCKGTQGEDGLLDSPIAGRRKELVVGAMA